MIKENSNLTAQKAVNIRQIYMRLQLRSTSTAFVVFQDAQKTTPETNHKQQVLLQLHIFHSDTYFQCVTSNLHTFKKTGTVSCFSSIQLLNSIYKYKFFVILKGQKNSRISWSRFFHKAISCLDLSHSQHFTTSKAYFKLTQIKQMFCSVSIFKKRVQNEVIYTITVRHAYS